MPTRVRSGAALGVDGFLVHVELDTVFGSPSFAPLGVPAAAVQESRNQVKAAIKNAGFDFAFHAGTGNR